MNKNYTPKQIQKYKRQKFISALNKCTKNLYRLFKNGCKVDEFIDKFTTLKEEISKFEDGIYIHNDATKRVKEYIDNLYLNTVCNKNFTQEILDTIKDKEISNLNRLQKIKNSTKYSKDKYKNNFF